MAINIAETFELLFDKNNNVAYKAMHKGITSARKV